MVRLAIDYVPLDALAPADDLLGVVTFGARHPLASLEVPGMRQLGPQLLAEVWCGEGAYFGTWTSDDEDVERASRTAYDDILRTIREQGFPHLLRAWNHVRELNQGAGDEERYRRFCAGRHDAFDAAGWTNRMLPAASGVGMREGSLSIYYVAGREPGRHVENPRQVSAYDYPRQYGRRSPSFARATVMDDFVFVSGTSSVVGHETRHAGDVDAQVDETLINLDAVLRAAGTRGVDSLQLVKTYLRRAEDYPRVAARIAAALPAAKALFVESDICRDDLLVEVDGVGRL
jgi:chorismate lyase/3-hydroxybenzoate synthase